MKRYVPLLSLALLSLAPACKKDSTTPAPTVTSKLINNKWQLRSASISGPGQPTIDGYAIASSCTKDDVIQYLAPNILSYDEGATKCDPNDPQKRTGTWVLSNNDTQLTVTLDSHTSVYTIDELTDNSLKLTNVSIQGSNTTTIKTGYVPVP